MGKRLIVFGLIKGGDYGEPLDFFPHRQGFRQGDPLSPMLFLLTVDVFQQMLKVANSTLTHPISLKIPEYILALQYADDTALVANADRATIETFFQGIRFAN